MDDQLMHAAVPAGLFDIRTTSIVFLSLTPLGIIQESVNVNGEVDVPQDRQQTISEIPTCPWNSMDITGPRRWCSLLQTAQYVLGSGVQFFHVLRTP